MAVEVTRDGSIHFHYKNFRLHVTAMDFYELADVMREVLLSLCVHLRKKIDITASNTICPSISNEYVKLLEEYKKSEEKVSPVEVSSLRNKMKWYERHPQGDETTEADLQRPTERLPNKFPGTIPEDLNTRYPYAVYESIKEWGYAKGPFHDDLMPAYQYPNGNVYLKGAHRTAALLVLGYTEIDVLLVAPPAGWSF